MDQNIEQTYVPQFSKCAPFQLSQFPVGNLVNPGIGGTFQEYDFCLPVYGKKQETLKVEKNVTTIPGSVPEKTENFATNTQDKDLQGVPVANQGGFGNVKNDIFKAMQTPKIKVNKIAFVPPKKEKGIEKTKRKKLSTSKFKLV